MADQFVHFWFDNMVIIQVINSLNSKLSLVMCLVWAFTLSCLMLTILFLARHVPGVDNGVADAFSCKQMEISHQMAHHQPQTSPLSSKGMET